MGGIYGVAAEMGSGDNDKHTKFHKDGSDIRKLIGGGGFTETDSMVIS
jgi:hypothetical protein